MSWMDGDGVIQGTESFETSEQNLIEKVGEIESQTLATGQFF